MREQIWKAQSGSAHTHHLGGGQEDVVGFRITELRLTLIGNFHRCHEQYKADKCHGYRTRWFSALLTDFSFSSLPLQPPNILLPLLHPDDNLATYSICDSLHCRSLKGLQSQNKHSCVALKAVVKVNPDLLSREILFPNLGNKLGGKRGNRLHFLIHHPAGRHQNRS